MMWNVVCREANLYIGGLENTLNDFGTATKEYKEAKADLMDFEGTRKYVAEQVYTSPEWKSLQNTHFITKAWLDTRIFNLTRKILKETREFIGMTIADIPARIED
jgi:hypothetical protein